MTKEIATSGTVFSGEGLVVRGSGPLIDGVAAHRAKVLPNERGRLRPIIRADDRTGSPTSTSDVAEAIRKLLTRKYEGLFHFAGDGYVSRLDSSKIEALVDEPIAPWQGPVETFLRQL
jgi:dTDP-4-dehydrorhamnose reductase